MIRLVACCVCLIIASVNANAVRNPTPNIAAEARRIVRESNWAAVGSNSTINSKQWTIKLIKSAEDNGDIFFYLPLNRISPETNDTKRIELIYTDRLKDMTFLILGSYQKLREGSDVYTRGMKAYRSADTSSNELSAGHLFKVDITKVVLMRISGASRVVKLREYFAGTDDVNSKL